VRDALLAAGLDEHRKYDRKRTWVNFEGADRPSEDKYSTCIPLNYAMDPTNDVILAYEINDVPLPPEHGYPVRLMIPGYVGGRCVKWVEKIWISEQENDPYYHIWDNRVMLSFMTEKNGPFAETLFRHPSAACNEQNLNSAIVKPAQDETNRFEEARKGNNYRIEGYSFDGGGHEVQRVEASLDEGETWLYCTRRFPELQSKFWTCLRWHVDVSIPYLIQSKSITVRCFNIFKNTQPERPNWNVLGMMNNSYYRVKGEIVEGSDSNSGSGI
ncbi:hypothetical protein IQ07DRAFT_670338, partial [Pyrenochaeta sp. DS3sAY3a]